MTSNVVRKVFSIAAATGFLMACGGGGATTTTTATTTPPTSGGTTTTTTATTTTTPDPTPVAPAGFQPTAEDLAAWEHAHTLLDMNARANFGGTDVNSGFAPDPWAGPLTAGGGRNPVNIADLHMKDEVTGEACTQSFVTKNPDFKFNFTANLPLVRFYVVTEDDSDATLVINEPSGHWRCNDDHGKSDWTHPDAPTVDFHNPASGRYDIWVGSFDGSRGHRAKLYVTELDSNHP